MSMSPQRESRRLHKLIILCVGILFILCMLGLAKQEVFASAHTPYISNRGCVACTPTPTPTYTPTPTPTPRPKPTPTPRPMPTSLPTQGPTTPAATPAPGTS